MKAVWVYFSLKRFFKNKNKKCGDILHSKADKNNIAMLHRYLDLQVLKMISISLAEVELFGFLIKLTICKYPLWLTFRERETNYLVFLIRVLHVVVG